MGLAHFHAYFKDLNVASSLVFHLKTVGTFDLNCSSYLRSISHDRFLRRFIFTLDFDPCNLLVDASCHDGSALPLH